MSGLTEGLKEYRRKIAAGEIEKPVLKTPFEKLREKPSPIRAIRALCFNCMGWEDGGERPPGVMDDIRGCTSTGCPLYEFRPYK